jgi:uncharacterized iron-regulated membrane protein
MKIFFRNIHLYLSLAAGLVIAIVCLTGAILVFEKEMQMFIYPQRYKAEVLSSPTVSIDQMIANLKKQEPDAGVSSVKIYSDPERTVELSYKKEEKRGEEAENGKSHAPEAKNPAQSKSAGDTKDGSEKKKEGSPAGNSQAFMNPYTGQLTAMQSQRSPFFFTVFSLHRWLLAGDTGKLIVGVSTSMFLFILITGIVLWWPQNKKILKQRLSIKWNAGWKRINHDWHIVIGFYTAIFLFAFAFTGLAWSFKWFNDGIFWITNSENKRPEPPKSTAQEGAASISFDQAFAMARKQMPDAEYYTISKPQEADAAVTVTVMPANAIHEKATNQLFYDQYTGEQLGQLLYKERSLGQRVRTTFYPVHVGSIGGLPGRIIAFISCLAGFTFPITGVILWINRLKKNKKKNTSVKQAASKLV